MWLWLLRLRLRLHLHCPLYLLKRLLMINYTELLYKQMLNQEVSRIHDKEK